MCELPFITRPTRQMEEEMADDGSIKIEMGVPMPSARWSPGPATHAVKALAEAPVGASVLVAPCDKPFTIQQAAYRLGGRGWISLRKEAGGYRVWKVGEPALRPAQ